MDKAEFTDEFRDNIEVLVDWDQFESRSWQVELLHLTMPEDLAQLWTPWFANGTDHNDAKAKSLSVLEVAAYPGLVQEHEAKLARHMQKWKDDQTIRAPAYAIGDDEFLLLDRNHRIVAGTILKRAAKIELAVIRGPRGSGLLLDLPGLD